MQAMRRRVVVGTLLWATLAMGSVSVAQDAGGAIGRVEALGRVLQQHPVWRAAYDQVYLAPGMTIGDRAAGTVWLAWPDRTRFATNVGAAQEMGLEGRRVRLVDPLTPSCEEHQLSDDEWARIPLSVVLDPRRAVDRFVVDALGDDGFVLLPREPGGVARVEVRLGADGMPAEVVVVDAQEARNRLRFNDWAAAEPPPNGWLPPVPAGIECATEPYALRAPSGTPADLADCR